MKKWEIAKMIEDIFRYSDGQYMSEEEYYSQIYEDIKRLLKKKRERGRLRMKFVLCERCKKRIKKGCAVYTPMSWAPPVCYECQRKLTCFVSKTQKIALPEEKFVDSKNIDKLEREAFLLSTEELGVLWKEIQHEFEKRKQQDHN